MTVETTRPAFVPCTHGPAPLLGSCTHADCRAAWWARAEKEAARLVARGDAVTPKSRRTR